MRKKIIGIFVCMLLLIPVLSSTVTATQEPILEINIDARSSFFGAIIIEEYKNIGDADAINISITTRLKHPIFKILDFTLNKTGDIIKAGETKRMIVGLSWIGRFEYTVTASISGGTPVTKTVKGFALPRFIFIFPD